jgi:hypothetical protein
LNIFNNNYIFIILHFILFSMVFNFFKNTLNILILEDYILFKNFSLSTTLKSTLLLFTSS